MTGWRGGPIVRVSVAATGLRTTADYRAAVSSRTHEDPDSTTTPRSRGQHHGNRLGPRDRYSARVERPSTHARLGEPDGHKGGHHGAHSSGPGGSTAWSTASR